MIGGKTVSNDTPALIIAEAGINHDGSLNQALRLIDMAADAGADVVKFQLFTAKYMYPKTGGSFTTANGKEVDIYNLIEEAEMPEVWIPRLMEHCEKRKVGFLCTTCDEKSTDILEKYSVDAYKIASSEITHLPLLKYTASKGKTMIISEGACRLKDVAEAIDEIQACGNSSIALMHCTVEYPAEMKYCNMNLIETYRKIFPDAVIGFSDHTMDPSLAPVHAIIKGAKIIEKHITVDKTLPGADHCYALEFHELKKMVEDIRAAERSPELFALNDEILGKYCKDVEEGELIEYHFIHRGIFSISDIKSGDLLTSENIAVLRPGNSENGLSPKMYEVILNHGVRANRDIPMSTPIVWEDILNLQDVES